VARYYFLSEGCFLKFAVLSFWSALSDERSGLLAVSWLCNHELWLLWCATQQEAHHGNYNSLLHNQLILHLPATVTELKNAQGGIFPVCLSSHFSTVNKNNPNLARLLEQRLQKTFGTRTFKTWGFKSPFVRAQRRNNGLSPFAEL
jgi:hypothetical protein